jgi:hypothetical protein
MAGLCLLLSLALLHAQVTSGSVSGTVADAQGAVVPGAKVTLTDQVQATTRTMTASGDGNFYFTPVLPSTYTVVIEAPGFKKFQKQDIKVSLGDRIEVAGIKLDVGAVTESVVVEANALALDTESAQHKSNIAGQQLVDMPIVDRNAEAAQTTPFPRPRKETAIFRKPSATRVPASPSTTPRRAASITTARRFRAILFPPPGSTPTARNC